MKKKKLLTIMLSLAMAFSLIPNVGAKAADDTATVTDATPDLGVEEQSVAADAGATELTGVVINIDEPKVGEKPDSTLEFNDREVYATCTGTTEEGYPLGWFENDNGTLKSVNVFEEGKRYELYFQVNTVNGCVLKDGDLIQVNEDDIVANEFVNQEKQITYFYCRYDVYFPVPAEKRTPIKTVDLSVDFPSVGTVFEVKDGYLDNFVKVTASDDQIDADGWLISGLPSEGDNYSDGFVGTIENGKYYYVNIIVRVDDSFKITEDTVINVNGGLPYEIEENGYDPEDPSYIWIVVKVRAGEGNETYKILDGDNQTLTIGSGLKVRASGDLKDCKGIKIDGQWVDLQYLKFESGSTIVTVAADYLSKLSAGEHTLTFVYYFGEVSTKFTIKASANDSVKTGDTAPVAMMAGLMICALAGMAFLKKKEY